MHKAIGFIACVSVMAASLYLFSGGDPSRTLSAQTESDSSGVYGSPASKLMNEARQRASQGKIDEARQLAEAAAAMSPDWQDGEQTPQQFLKSLGRPVANADVAWSLADEAGWTDLEPENIPEPKIASTANPFAAQAVGGVAQPTGQDAQQPGASDLVKKQQAMQLLRESRKALDEGNTAVARTRAMQARQLNVAWGLWDQRPDHILSEIDRAEGVETFLASTGGPPTPRQPTPMTGSSQEHQKASALLKEARFAMDNGQLQRAEQLAQQASAMNVAYGMFDDNPSVVLRDIKRLAESGGAPATGFDNPQVASSEVRQAQNLLQQARAALAQGRLGDARSMATEAQNLNVAYNLLDDRPELILGQIDRVLGGRGQQTSPATSGNIAMGSAASEDARNLVAQARGALASGDLDQARNLAVQAQQQDAAFGLLDDRPELVLEDAQLVAQRQLHQDPSRAVAQGGPVDLTPAGSGVWNDPKIGLSSFDPASELTVIHPNGASAEDSYQRGLALLRAGQRGPAKAAFQHAWENAGQLDGRRRQQLQDFLAELSRDRAVDVSLASAQQGDPLQIPQQDVNPLATAANEHDVRYDRLRTEVMNSVFRAEKLKEQNGEEALQILDRTLATVEGANLSEEAAQTLSGYVQRSQQNVKTYLEQRAPMIELADRNRNVEEEIERQIEQQIRMETEFKELNTEFNDLMRQRRYPEAELVAQKAYDLNPTLPQAVIMVQKSAFARQNAFNDDVRARQAARNLETFNDIENAMAGPRGDYTLPDAKSWSELTTRRERYGRADGRRLTPSEQQIEKSLSEQISLHFHDTSLTEIIRHIATVHGINIALDKRAIETEGILPSQPVSIDVDGITLRSALHHLLDQAGGLVYTVKDEVLLITNRLEQETQFESRAYNVADLVVPMNPPGTQNLAGGGTVTTMGANGLGGSSGLFQVNDDLAVNIGANGSPRRGGDVANADRIDFSGLTDLIMTTIEPGSWVVDGGSGDINGNENTLSLVIRQTPAVHDEIGDLLRQLRKLQDLQVTVEVRFISVTDRFFERIGVDFDFNVQDNLGDPPGVPAFGSRQLQFPGATGGGGGNNQGGDLRGNTNQGGGGQQGQNNQQTTAGLFDTVQRVNSPRDDHNGSVVGLSTPDSFSEDYDIQFRQGSFEIGVPDFGNFNPDAGIQVGMAILSDIEAFFFIQAAQADERANLLFAPKVTLFNGQLAIINDQTTRPYVAGLIPVVGQGAVGFQPITGFITDGIQLQVVAVVSADRRFVRLSLAPQFNNLVDLFTFSFASGGAGGGAAFGGGVGGGGGGFGGQGGGGGGGQFGFGGIGGGFGGGGQGGGQAGQGGVGGQQQQQGAAGGSLTVQQPVVEVISVQTTVTVPDGGTVLLGGIKRLREGRNMAGVPILNKIPYVSRLFKNSGVGRETESVMLMVTPRIIIHEEEEELILGTSAQ